MSEIVDKLVRELAEGRRLLEEARRNEAESQRLLDACYQSENLAKDREKRKTVEVMVGSTYDALRAAALDAYRASGDKDKHPHPAVEIEKRRVVNFEDVQATIAWAEKAFPELVSKVLDEKVIRAMSKATAIPGVKVSEEPRATIASDLSAYLGGE